MPHIFISYSKKDTRDLALKLTDALNALPGVTAWMDRSLKVGANWDTQIELEIRRCDYFVVLYSPDINRHHHGEPESFVLTEIRYAKHTARRPIIPVMAQMTSEPLLLSGMQYIDYTLPGATLADLVEAIRAECSIDGQQPPPPPDPIARLKALLPAPFEMIPIPAGKVTLETGKTFDVPAFRIARYPVTNAHYRPFVAGGEYSEQRWWTTDGWAARQAGRWTQPRFWDDAKWNQDDHPVVGVSWYEAVAYCRWLSAQTGAQIALPTEQMWQRAAQGDKGWTYPWGNKWDGARCNNSVGEYNSDGTTPVTQYAGKDKGDSPFGVSDMAGNVWEWCITDHHTGDQDVNKRATYRVLRGGAWFDGNADDFAAANRYWYSPDVWYYNIGFRFALL